MTLRPTRDEILMENAASWAKRSTCPRANVGAVFSREGRILSTGYNGAPAGMEHCNHECDCTEAVDNCLNQHDPNCSVCGPMNEEDHLVSCAKYQPCTNVVHAEANAISFAAKYGVGLDGAELHCTRIPCTPCAGLIINAGIIRVTWLEEHRDMGGWVRLANAGLDVVRWEV